MGGLIRHLGAVGVMFLGGGLVLGMMVMMNRFSQPPEKQAKPEATAIKVEPKKPKPKKTRPKPRRPKPKPSRAARPRTPPPNLGSSLSSVALGPPSGLLSDFSSAGGDLLGGGGGRNLVMTSDSVDEPPKPTRRVAPAYPASARKRGITGYVTFQLTIGPDGAIQHSKIVAAEPPGVFEDAARAAMARWSFNPGRYQGEPQTVSGVKQTIRFALTRGG